jgi:hypothetical protein
MNPKYMILISLTCSVRKDVIGKVAKRRNGNAKGRIGRAYERLVGGTTEALPGEGPDRRKEHFNQKT